MGSRPDLPLVGIDPLLPATEPARALAHRWDYRLARTLLHLQSERWTGTLRVTAEGVATAVRLREGRPVFVEGGLPADSLGRVLVLRGWITEAELAQVVEQRMSIQGRQRFGDVARALGILDEAALATALDDQVRDKLTRCLHWEYGELSLEEGDHGFPHRSGVPLSVEPLVRVGVYRHFGPARVQDVLAPAWGQPVQLPAARERVAQRFHMSAEETALLDQALAAESVGQFLLGPHGESARAGQLLCALALTDQLRMPSLAPRPECVPTAEPPQSPETADNDQFGARAKAGAPIGRLRLVRKSQPVPRPLQPSLDHEEPERIPSRDRLLADSAFLQGRELMRVGEFAAAADALKTASALRPGAREYALHAAWAGYVAGGRNARWRARLDAQCQGALAQDQHLAFAHHVMGQLALEDGDRQAAHVHLRRAVELDPNDELARDALAQLEA